MRTLLNFNIEKLIKNFDTEQNYIISKEKSSIFIKRQYKNGRGRPFSIKLPKRITISPETAGLIVGEGFSSKYSFVFANSNEKIIDEVLYFLKQFNLPIKMYIEISMKNKADRFISECKQFWETHLKLIIERIRLRREFKSLAKHGTLHLIISNSLVARLMSELIEESKRIIENNQGLSIKYLKGVIAAEGNVNIKKTTKCVYMIRISASKIKDRSHYKKCLKIAGIDISCKDMPTISKEEGKLRGWKTDKGRAGAVIISRWKNFIKILELGLLDLNENKKRTFLEYFPNNLFTKQFMECAPFLNKEFTMKDAQDHFKFKGRHVDRVLSLYKQGYLSRRKINKIKHVYKTTEKYVQLYEKLNRSLSSPLIHGRL